MNNDILVIINWYEENINNLDHALERLNEIFKNIIICNRSNILIPIKNFKVIKSDDYNGFLNEINSYINEFNIQVKSLVFVDDIINTTYDDIVKCGMEAIENKYKIIQGFNDNYLFGEKFINNLFNMLFNTCFKSVLPDIKAINIDLYKSLLEKINKDDYNTNNYLITAVNENIHIKEKNIKTIWRKNQKRVGWSKERALPYLKSLIPYTLKSIIPYLISLMLFMLIFYISNNPNDLKGIIFANLISEGVGIVIHIILNYKTVYKNNFISKNILFILKKLFRIILGCFFIYILYNLLNINLFISKIIVDLILMILIAISFNSLFIKK